MYLLVVVAAAGVTAVWAVRSIAMNLSVIETTASFLGLDERVATTREVGYAQEQPNAQPAPAPYCQPGQQPAFANGMAALHEQVGAAMGTAVECEHAVGASGNTVQQTSTGLAAYDRARNTESFTDGWHHWALGSDGLQAWEGTSAAPPPPGG